MTLQTIADRVGVSRMTVSNAFSNPTQLSEALRAKILAAADELGYAGPDPSGRALATGTSSAIGILLTDTLDEAFTDDVATTFLGAIAQSIEGRGLAMTLLTAGQDDDTTVPARDVALDGAMVYSCRPTSPGRDWLIRRKLPLVFVDQDPIDGVAAVNVDDRGGARAAGRHVAELGHTRVAVMTYVVPERSGAAGGQVYGRAERERLEGWREGLGDVDPVVVDLAHAADDDDVRAAARDLLTSDEAPTAIMCFSDLMALQVIGVASELGVRVPDDLSVVGFDDARFARFTTPPLTTVRQDVAAKGAHAATLLLAAIDARRDGVAPPTDRITLPTELVVRASTAEAPATS